MENMTTNTKTKREPAEYIYFRENKDHAWGDVPMRMPYREVWPLLCANFRNPNRALDNLMRGKEIRSKFGVYRAEIKQTDV